MSGWVRDLNQSDGDETAAPNYPRTVGSLASAALIGIVGDHRRDDAAKGSKDGIRIGDGGRAKPHRRGAWQRLVAHRRG